MQAMMLRSLTILLSATWLANLATGGSFHFGETRYFPREYSRPTFSRDRNGRVTYSPSVPTSFERYDLGVGGQTSNVRVSGSQTIVVERSNVTLRIKHSGHQIKVYEGEQFTAGGTRYQLLTVWDDAIQVKRLDTGEVIRQTRPPKKP